MVCLIFALLATTAVQANEYCPDNFASNAPIDAKSQENTAVNSTANKGDKDTYEGEVILFVIEPVSNHWKNSYNNEFYRMAFLDYALRQSISITETDTFETTVTWYAPDNGYSYIEEQNIAVVAGVFNNNGHPAYADPPSSNPFTAYYSDAAAYASPDHPGANEVTEDFTHSVIGEEGTATYCGYCPYVMDALSNIIASGDYPFHYVALVGDMTSDLDDYIAHARLSSEYNFAGYPTTFLDGGHQVRIGGVPSSESILRSAIQICGAREVTGLVMNLDVEYIGTYEISVHVQIYQGDASNQAPTTPAAPSGDALCVTDRTYSCSATGTDPDEDDIYYKWDIDGYETEWDGPYASGAAATADYTFTTAGTKSISVKIKDVNDVESDWSDAMTVEARLCGDVNNSGGIDIDDIVFMIAYVFQGGTTPEPVETADPNCSGGVDIDDIVYEIAYVFQGGAAPCTSCE